MTGEAVVPRLRRTTTGGEAERTLRELILDGRLEPGTHLREKQLAASLGVSRNTLREALRGLAQMGLVTHEPHRGVVVTALTADDVADLYRLRAVLEPAALPFVDEERLDELQAAIDAFGDALARGDDVEALEWDLQFHAVLVEALGSPRLSAAHERAEGELRLALLDLDRTYEPPQVEEHRRIVEALRRGDVRNAETALREHLDRAAENLKSLVQAKTRLQAPERST